MKINEVAKMFNLPTSTLRYYESEGLLGPINRVNGVREFTKKDLERLDFIICTKNCGMTITEIKNFIQLYQRGNETIPSRLAILKRQLSKSEKQLRTLQQSIDHLKDKIVDVQNLSATADKQNLRN